MNDTKLVIKYRLRKRLYSGRYKYRPDWEYTNGSYLEPQELEPSQQRMPGGQYSYRAYNRDGSEVFIPRDWVESDTEFFEGLAEIKETKDQ